MTTMKNKLTKSLLGLAALTMAFTSCSESFLDKEPTSFLTPEQLADIAKLNPDALKSSISGLYSLTFQFGTGGTERHDDFGQKSYDITMDLMSGDMAMSGESYGWFSDASRLLGYRTTEEYTYMFWRYHYRLIKNTNLIFEIIGGDEVIPDREELAHYYGQAKAMRAYSYFQLVNMYGKQYTKDPNDLAVPFYDAKQDDYGTQLTVADTYAFIEADLLQAIDALEGFTRANKNEINQDVAKGMLAYVYLQMGNDKEAARLSGEVIANNKFPMLAKTEVSTTGFNNWSSPNWMWAIDLTIDNSPALPTFWGQVDKFTYSYAWAGDAKIIDSDLFASIPATDARKNWFDADGLPVWKFYDGKRDASEGGVNKTWDNDEVYMRIEEMYLINAEALARDNRLPEAKTSFKVFLNQRDETVAATVDAMDEKAFLALVEQNWRVEMWGEGRSLLTMKRFDSTHKRGANHLSGMAGVEVAAQDPRLIYEIPQAEILNNPNVK